MTPTERIERVTDARRMDMVDKRTAQVRAILNTLDNSPMYQALYALLRDEQPKFLPRWTDELHERLV